MKKINYLIAMAAIAIGLSTTSCNKFDLGDVNTGSTKTFVYQPSLIEPTGFAVTSANTASVRLSNNTIVSVNCVSRGKGGTALIFEAPIIPERWAWSASSNQYMGDGAVYNEKWGFSSSHPKVCYVEKTDFGTYIFHFDKVNWGSQPNPASWTGSFRGLSGISSYTMPANGVISEDSYGTFYFSL